MEKENQENLGGWKMSSRKPVGSNSASSGCNMLASDGMSRAIERSGTLSSRCPTIIVLPVDGSQPVAYSLHSALALLAEAVFLSPQGHEHAAASFLQQQEKFSMARSPSKLMPIAVPSHCKKRNAKEKKEANMGITTFFTGKIYS